MKKLIEVVQQNLIECDHCDYLIPNEDPRNPGDGKEYINQPCPMCGENLLTEKDYLLSKKIDEKIKWLNKWFSWINWFVPGKRNSVDMKVHDGIEIKSRV